LTRTVVCLWLIALAALAASAGARASLLAPLADTSAWRLSLLPQQKLPVTRFSRVEVDGRQALRIEAQGSYGNVVHAVSAAAAAARTLSWHWRVDRPVAGADLRQRSGDDAAAKICVMFDLPLDRVPFLERQTLRLARASAGEALPAATICYVWDARLSAGTVLPNAYTRRMRWIVLQGQGAAPGRWQLERRDVAADFLRAFGDESPEVPPIAAVVVGADADNTSGSALSHVADLELTR
jgi:Protein of unknown function (DUF3047)